METKACTNKLDNHLTRQDWIFLSLLFTVALLVRLIGIKFGTPLLTHPDEPTMLMPVIKMTRDHTLNPEHFSWPSQFLYRFYYFYLNLVSYLKFGANVSVTFDPHREYFYYAARRAIAVFGALTAVMAYLIGREFKPRFSLPAGIIFCFYPAYVIHSHYATPDVPITLYTLVIILFCLRYLNGRGTTYLWLAILFAAINTADKYPGIMSLGIVFVTIIIKEISQATVIGKKRITNVIKKCCISFLVFIVLLFLVGPYLFLDFKDVLPAFSNEARPTHLGFDGLGWWGNLLYYARNFFNSTNLLLSLFIILGIVGIIKTKQRNGILLTYGVVYWILLSVLALHQERWAFPMYTAPLLIAAFGMCYLWSILKQRKALQVLAATAMTVALVLLALRGVSSSTNMALTDTRAASYAYANENNITKNNSLFEGYTPFNPRGIPQIYDFNWEDTEATKFVILSSFMYDRYYAEPERYSKQISFYENVKKHTVLLAEFEPSPEPDTPARQIDSLVYYLKRHLGQPVEARLTGPTIQIYKMNR